jgi:hypothetical protein
MSTNVIQPSFAAGELSPSLYARVDFAKYKVGAAKMLNWFTDYRGGAATRPGTRYICETLNSLEGNPDAKSHLIPFSFSTEQTYMLILGNFTMQVIKQGGLVLSGGSPYTLTTPWRWEDLIELKYTQSADVMTIAHPDYPAFNLSRTADDAWTLTQVSFNATQPAPTGVGATPLVGGGTTTYKYVVTAVNSVTGEESLPSSPGSTATSKIMSADGTETVTVAWTAASGSQYYNIYRQAEVPNTAAATGQIYGYIGSSTTVSFKDHNSSPNFTVTPPQHYDPFGQYGYPGVVCYFQQRQWFGGSNAFPVTFYASQTGNFANMDRSLPIRDSDGIVGTLAASANSNTIQVNDIRHMLPMPFGLVLLSTSGAWQVTGGQQGSAVTPASIQVAPQSFVGANNMAPIQVNRDILYVQDKGTNVRELTYDFYAQTYYGKDVSVLANHLFQGASLTEWCWQEEPRKMAWCIRDDGIGLFFTYLKEQEVYAWSRFDTNGLYMSIGSVSEGEQNAVYTIVKRFIGCGAARPSVILREDSTTPDNWERVAYTDGCTIEADVQNFDGESDLLREDMTLILRQDVVGVNSGRWVQYVERFDNFDYLGNAGRGIPALIEDAWCVDCGLAYPQPTPDGVLYIGAATGDSVSFSVAAVQAEFDYRVTDEGDVRWTDDEDVRATEDDPTFTFTSDMIGWVIRGGGGIAVIVAVVSESVVLCDITQAFRNVLPYNQCGMVIPLQSGEWTLTEPTTEVTGLEHLEGMEVVGIADGNVQPRQIVVDGTYQIQVPATAITVGLPYQCTLQTMRLDVQADGGTIQGKRKRIAAVTARVLAARGLFMGQTEDTLIEYKQRNNEAMGEPIQLQTGDQRVVLPPNFNLEGQMVFKVCDPVPATVLGVIPEIQLGDVP